MGNYKNEQGKLKVGLMASNAFLFAWNPNNWPFNELEQKTEELKKTGKVTVVWSVAAHKKVKVGDRAFICQVGSKVKGVFAAGYIISEPFLSEHWSGKDKLVPRVLIELEILLNPKMDPILDIEILKKEVSIVQQWTPQSSGIQIRNEIINELEKIWFKFLEKQNIFTVSTKKEQVIMEGAAYQIAQTLYERNQYARTICLQHHGYSCCVCGFNFKDSYGEIGEGFIHVHHLNPLSTIAEKHATNPIIDLCPVCPNCHSMLHKKNPPYTIEQLKEKMSMLN